MSQAFVREGDDMWLNEVAPTVSALCHFLTKQNGGVRIHLIKTTIENGREVFWMTDGMQYAKNEKNEWEIVSAIT